MLYKQCLLSPEYIHSEIENVFSKNAQFKSINRKYFETPQCTQLSELVLGTIHNLKCNDILLICDSSCPKISGSYINNVYFNVSKHESIHKLFLPGTFLQRYEKEGAFIVLPGWLDKWQDNLITTNSYNKMHSFSLIKKYSHILVLDTGVHSNLIAKAEDFSRSMGMPFKVLDVGMEHFTMFLEKLILQWDADRKNNRLKLCDSKIASYAMSIDFIKKIADNKDEASTIEAICKLFSTMFAPKNVIYHSFHDNVMITDYQKSETISGTERPSLMEFKDSDQNYILFESVKGFAIKISITEEVLGIVEVLDIELPQHITEYISVAYDLAKVSGLAISNTRRYHRISKAKEEKTKLADMLQITNRILRHDIANDLQAITWALDLLQESNNDKAKNDKFMSIIRSSAKKSVSLISNMQEFDITSGSGQKFVPIDVKKLVKVAISKHDANFSVKGNCTVMADKAMSSVIDNIISNAVIHGRANKVEISMEQINNKCSICIADNGIGIPDEVKPRIFDEGFKHGNTGNTGFGLFITKKTVERCRGSINVQDNIPHGTKFIIELPSENLDDHILQGT